MEYNRSLIDYLPAVTGDTEEFKEIMSSENIDIDKAWQAFTVLENESFVASAEGIGLERLEKICGLSADGLTVKQRRAQIILKLMGDTPYTMCTLYDRLSAVYGSDISLAYGTEPYTLTVTAALKLSPLAFNLKKLLYKILPANIGLKLVFAPDEISAPLYFGTAVLEERRVYFNECGASGLNDETAGLADEDGVLLADEDNNLLIDC